MKKFFTILCLVLALFLVGCRNNDKIIIPLPDDKEDIENPDNPDPNKDLIEYIHTKVLLLDIKNNYIELLNTKATLLTKDTKVLKKVGEDIKVASLDDLYIGMENIYVKTKGKEIVLEILIDEEPIFNNIRVAIRYSIDDIADEKTLYHDKIAIQTNNETIIKEYDGNKAYKVKAHVTLNFSVQDDSIICYNDKLLIKSDKRLIIKGGSREIAVPSIRRAYGTPRYAGNLEIAIVNGRLLLINDCPMEEYLRKVVPSEMPASWHPIALRSQAVAARTYAYSEIYNKKFDNLGYVVDDSTSSQVYNNGYADDNTDLAVRDTKGIVMVNNNKPIVSYYYSSGCGLRASGNEVWIKNKVIEEIPYLQGGNVSNTEVDTSDEVAITNYFQNLTVQAPSVNSSRFRWKITFTKEQLTNTLNANVYNMSKNQKECYPIKVDGKWVEKDFPNEIGEVKDIRVSERGSSGVVISLEVVCTNVIFRIYNQYNIRFTVRPRDGGSTVRGESARGNKGYYEYNIDNSSILPSGFFAIVRDGNNYIFYGGGSGHGVGMDQYGAQFLAINNKSTEEILRTYYTNIDFIDTSVEYKELEDFSKYFS